MVNLINNLARKVFADWNKLFDYLGGASVAGGKLKAAGSDYWIIPNLGLTNDNG